VINKALAAPLRQHLCDLTAFAVQLGIVNCDGTEAVAAFVSAVLSPFAVGVRGAVKARSVKTFVVRSAVTIDVVCRVVDVVASTIIDQSVAQAVFTAAKQSLSQVVQLLAICTREESLERSERLHALAQTAAADLRGREHLGASVTAELALMQARAKQQRAAEQTRAMHAKSREALSREYEKEREAEEGAAEHPVGKRSMMVGGRIRRSSTIQMDDGGKHSRASSAPKKAHRTESRGTAKTPTRTRARE
jgi:hypothetical protein